uniref:Ankyrin-1-like n=1 Tax=Saccoglossus kowalevskii TaxID=10224 RepID=A0ABM0M846_SACKO|nr:PREDICTED: ankyrin-1-like [Saccoglossus kowalevskii]
MNWGALFQEDNLGRSPLHWAVAEGDVPCLSELLHGCEAQDLDRKDKMGQTPVHFAVQLGYTDVVALLVQKGCSLTKRNIDGLTPLLLAACYGHCDIFKTILAKNDKYINQTAMQGRTALHFAAASGEVELCDYLLQIGIDISAVDINGHTPLFIAVTNGNVNVAKLLIKRRAKILNATDKLGRSCLHYAAEGGNIQLTSLLVAVVTMLKLSNKSKAAQSWMDLKDDTGSTALYLAALKNHRPVCRLLLDFSATTDKRGEILLFNMVLTVNDENRLSMSDEWKCDEEKLEQQQQQQQQDSYLTSENKDKQGLKTDKRDTFLQRTLKAFDRSFYVYLPESVKPKLTTNKRPSTSPAVLPSATKTSKLDQGKESKIPGVVLPLRKTNQTTLHLSRYCREEADKATYSASHDRANLKKNIYLPEIQPFWLAQPRPRTVPSTLTLNNLSTSLSPRLHAMVPENRSYNLGSPRRAVSHTLKYSKHQTMSTYNTPKRAPSSWIQRAYRSQNKSTTKQQSIVGRLGRVTPTDSMERRTCTPSIVLPRMANLVGIHEELQNNFL